MTEYDDLVASLWVLDDVLEEISLHLAEVHECILQIGRERRGRPLKESIPTGSLLFQNLATIDSSLTRTGARVRRAMVKTLVAEGVQASEIATLFGVSRQRISKLLHEDLELDV